MTHRQPFAPSYGRNQILTATSSSQNVPLGDRFGGELRILNTGSNIAYVRVYDNAGGSQSASTADFPVPAGVSSTITRPEGAQTLGYISALGTTLQVMPGVGF